MSKQFFCIAAFLLSIGCSRQPKQAEVQASTKTSAPLAITTAAVETRRSDQTISITGALMADESVTISSEVAGRVAFILTDFGRAVRKGDVIAELDKQEYLLQVERSKAALAQALARVGLDPSQENAVPTSTPGMRQAIAQMEDAKFKYENAAQLVKSGDVSQEHYNELEKAYRARQAAAEATRDDMRMQWANVEALRADVKIAQKRVDNCTMRAPFDGAVTQKSVSAGQYMKENTAVLTLVKTSPLRLRVELPESAAGSVHTGTSLTFTTDAAPGAEFGAVVRELNPSLDDKSRSLTAEARLATNDTRLRPGMFVQVSLVTVKDAKVLVAPKQAVYSMAGLTKLFVIRNGRAVECRIPPGRDLGGWTEITGAQVAPGEQVAVSNLALLFDGAPVKRAN